MTLRWFHAIATAEALSLLALFGIAMPLKYAAGRPEAVAWVGWIHGVLFLIYVVALLSAGRVAGWRAPAILAGLLASIVPFGPFVFHRWMRSS